MLEQYGLEAGLAQSELLVKRLMSRETDDKSAVLAFVKETYGRVFVQQVLARMPPVQEKFAEGIAAHGFDNFWRIEVFDDCEDVDELASEMDSEQGATPDIGRNR